MQLNPKRQAKHAMPKEKRLEGIISVHEAKIARMQAKHKYLTGMLERMRGQSVRPEFDELQVRRLALYTPFEKPLTAVLAKMRADPNYAGKVMQSISELAEIRTALAKIAGKTIPEESRKQALGRKAQAILKKMEELAKQAQ
ncbi:MAG TPA: hypothetical protein VI977_02470 [archaeon]|nr:hypothetical protein [archaeon]